MERLLREHLGQVIGLEFMHSGSFLVAKLLELDGSILKYQTCDERGLIEGIFYQEINGVTGLLKGTAEMRRFQLECTSHDV